MIERFLRGLSLGALVGAVVAGWLITRRRLRVTVAADADREAGP
jgi:Na+/glutamate symporter